MSVSEPIEILFLSQEDVMAVHLKMTDAMHIVDQALWEHGHGRAENPPKYGVHPVAGAFIHAMPAHIPRLRAAGLKWVSSFPGNARLGLPAVMGLMVVNDAVTGAPLAVMDGRWITAIRTGAVSALAARHLGRPDSRVFGLVGSGVQGRSNLLALREVLTELKVARVYDIDPSALEAYVSEMGAIMPFAVEAVASAEEAIREADVIVTATGRLEEPVYREAWVKSGALVLPVHHRGWENATLHRVDKFVTDDWAQLQHAHQTDGGFYGALPRPYAELGEIIIGKRPGRENPTERIIDFNYGLALEDVAMAAEVLARARAQGLGTTLPFLSGDLILV